MNFETFFREGFGDKLPYPYQVGLAGKAWPETLHAYPVDTYTH